MDEHEVLYRVECTRPSFYVAVQQFLDWVDAELRDGRYLVEQAPRKISDRYHLVLSPLVNRRLVKMEDPRFIAGAFRFQLDYDKIMALLMDRSLYPDPSLFVRELLQNALDACRLRGALENERKNTTYRPQIIVHDHTVDGCDRRIVVEDNGIGMSRRIVEEYFMKIGRSYYRSPEFAIERERLKSKGISLEACSQFGIGVLSCFMVGNHFEVTTRHRGSTPLRIGVAGPSKYFVIENLSGEPDDVDEPASGTSVVVHLRDNSSVAVEETVSCVLKFCAASGNA